MKQIFSMISDALFPRECVRCGAEGKEVCDLCFSLAMGEEWAGLCPVCKNLSATGIRCAGCESSIDGLISCAPYANEVVRGLIDRWKFHSMRKAIEPYLANLVGRVPLTQLFSSGWTVVPVPLHPRKERERGFNQAHVLAQIVGNATRLPVADALSRTRYTKPQSQRPEEQRKRGDLAGIFALKQPIQGRILLCDDVYTSGATMESAASTLKSQGATHVWGIVLAHGK